jgi:hypothetical protein
VERRSPRLESPPHLYVARFLPQSVLLTDVQPVDGYARFNRRARLVLGGIGMGVIGLWACELPLRAVM